jgi:hypothetical protein
MKLFASCVALYLLVPSGAFSAGADASRRLAQLRCVACHIIDQKQQIPLEAVDAAKQVTNLPKLSETES